MSVHRANRPLTVPVIRSRKGGEPIVCLTAYTAATAALIDPHVDLILVGDSLGMVIYGLPNTLSVTLDMMIAHGRAVARGAKRALVVIDMPFGSYEEGPAVAFRHAARLLAETGAQAVKLEGGAAMAETVAFLTSRGIPVMGHIGLMPQQVHARGGFIAQGTSRADWQAIEDDAQAIAAAGAFAVVVEAVSEPLAAAITSRLPVPTIGIGASAACDGQILVLDDMLGLTGQTPRFVKRYAELGRAIGAAVADYAAEVRGRQFPAAGHLYAVKD